MRLKLHHVAAARGSLWHVLLCWTAMQARLNAFLVKAPFWH